MSDFNIKVYAVGRPGERTMIMEEEDFMILVNAINKLPNATFSIHETVYQPANSDAAAEEDEGF